ncbi:MAG: hypothetical protein U0271_11525 [Polyangiaceae bacterium]
MDAVIAGHRARTVALGLLLFGAACGGKKGDSQPSGEGADAREERGVSVDAAGVRLDGRSVAAAPGDEIKRVDALYTALKIAREDWKAKRPSEPFPGKMDVRLPADISCRAAMSVLGSVAFAGYTKLTVSVGDKQHALVFAVPRPPDLNDSTVSVSPVLAFDQAGKVTVEKQPCGNAYDVVALKDAAGAPAGLLANKEVLRDVTARCDAGVGFAGVFDALVGVVDGTSPGMAVRDGVAAGLAPACIDGEPHVAFPEFRAALEQVGAGGDPDAPTATWGRDDTFGPRKALAPIALPSGFKKDVTITVSEVSGGVDDRTVTNSIVSTRDKLLGCYAAGLVNNGNLRGRIKATVQIGKRGLIVDQAFRSGDMPDGEVVRCVVAQLRSAAAIAPAPAKLATASVSLVFDDAPAK